MTCKIKDLVINIYTLQSSSFSGHKIWPINYLFWPHYCIRLVKGKVVPLLNKC